MKNKICIITSRNIFDSPCLEKYTKILEGSFDIIYWNRAGINETSNANNSFVFEKVINKNTTMLKKILLYLRFSSFCKRVLRRLKYDKLIIFPTQTAWLIHLFLKKHFSGKYVLDIRDYAGENNKIIYNLTSFVIKYSGYVSLTSEKYKCFLPSHDYHISHNLQAIDPAIITRYRNCHTEKSEIVRVSFIGSVRFLEQQKKIILLFKNDPRFHLYFIGKGSEHLDDFCKINKVQNVTLVGFFKRENLGLYYEQTELTLNAYGNNNPFLDYALSNKIYSSAIMGMPIIVSSNTYMSEIVQKYKIGFVLYEYNKECVDELYEYYRSLSIQEFYKNASLFLQDVFKDETEYIKTLTNYLNN